MEKFDLLMCHKILKKLMERPIARPFLEEGKNIPINFYTIQNKLYTNQFQSNSDFDNEMEILFQEFEEFASTYNYLKMCTKELKKSYRKKYQKYILSPNNKKSLGSLCSALANEIQDPPDNLIEFKERTFHNQSEPFYRPLTEDELEALSKQINDCTNMRIRNGVIAIFKTLGEMNPNFLTQDLHIELNKCSNQCQTIIRDYINEQLKKEGNFKEKA